MILECLHVFIAQSAEAIEICIVHRFERKALVDARLAELGAAVEHEDQATEYAHRYVLSYDGDLKRLADYLEDIDAVEILSIGHALELIKDLGDAGRVSNQYGLGGFKGTHGIGHTRMATESDVDIRSAHPYWAYPFNDVSVVHNGQLTNYWSYRRAMERRGHRFMSNCDSELIAVYLEAAQRVTPKSKSPNTHTVTASPSTEICSGWPTTSKILTVPRSSPSVMPWS